MLRVTVHNDDIVATIELQGKLTANWVGPVLETWNTLSLTGQTVSLDLSAVSYIDKAGRLLLAQMHARGVRLAGPGLMIRGVIEEITSR